MLANPTAYSLEFVARLLIFPNHILIFIPGSFKKQNISKRATNFSKHSANTFLNGDQPEHEEGQIKMRSSKIPRRLKKNFTTVIISAAILGSINNTAQAQINFNFTADNDSGLYVGNISGTNLRMIGNQTTAWMTMTTGSFTLLPGEDYFYLLGMNYGGLGDIGGFINSIRITQPTGWVYKNILLTGMPSNDTPGNEVFTPNLSELQTAINAGGFSANPATVSGAPSGAFGGYVSNWLLGNAVTFDLPDGPSARLFRQSVSAFGLTVAAAPEPGTLGLLLLGSIGFMGRRRRSSSPFLPEAAR